MKKYVLSAVAALLLVAPAADAKAFRGTVVKKNAKSVVVATSTGSLKTVRTARHFGLGTKLRVNGKSIKRLGHASRAKVSGVVRGNKAAIVVLSGNRTEIEVHHSASRHHAEGEGLLVTVRFSHGHLVETRSQEDRHIDDAEIRGIATVDASGVHLTVNGTVVDITIPAGADLAAIQAFNGQFVEVEFDVVNGVNVLRKIKAEDNDQEAEDEGLDDLTGTLTINADGTTISVTPVGGAPITLAINGVSLAGLATGDLVEAHFDVVNGPSGQTLNLTRIKSED